MRRGKKRVRKREEEGEKGEATGGRRRRRREGVPCFAAPVARNLNPPVGSIPIPFIFKIKHYNPWAKHYKQLIQYTSSCNSV